MRLIQKVRLLLARVRYFGILIFEIHFLEISENDPYFLGFQTKPSSVTLRHFFDSLSIFCLLNENYFHFTCPWGHWNYILKKLSKSKENLVPSTFLIPIFQKSKEKILKISNDLCHKFPAISYTCSIFSELGYEIKYKMFGSVKDVSLEEGRNSLFIFFWL